MKTLKIKMDKKMQWHKSMIHIIILSNFSYIFQYLSSFFHFYFQFSHFFMYFIILKQNQLSRFFGLSDCIVYWQICIVIHAIRSCAWMRKKEISVWIGKSFRFIPSFRPTQFRFWYQQSASNTCHLEYNARFYNIINLNSWPVFSMNRIYKLNFGIVFMLGLT